MCTKIQKSVLWVFGLAALLLLTCVNRKKIVGTAWNAYHSLLLLVKHKHTALLSTFYCCFSRNRCRRPQQVACAVYLDCRVPR